jgi:hypothetical protein
LAIIFKKMIARKTADRLSDLSFLKREILIVKLQNVFYSKRNTEHRKLKFDI